MTKNTKNVLVAGATGRIGSEVVRQLIERGHSVKAYVRSASSDKAKALAALEATLAEGDLTNTTSLEHAAKDVDAIFSITTSFDGGSGEDEIQQGKALATVASQLDKHLIYSSVAGRRDHKTNVEHFDTKQIIEADMAEKGVKLTNIGPVYFMENLLNFDFNQLKKDIYAFPLPGGHKLDQVSVLDIAAMAVYAIEHPAEMIGKRVEIAGDSISGEEIAHTLTEVIGRPIHYYRLPLEQVRQWAGDDIADMFQKFEDEPYRIDIKKLHAEYPDIHWHTFKDWAKTIDWETLLPAKTQN